MVMLTNSPIPLRMRIPYITPADMNTVAQMVGSHFGETDDMVYQQPEQLDEFREQKPIPFPRAIIPESNKRAEDVNLTEAIEYWNAFQPSTRDIEEEYELTNHQARRLRGFILDYADKRVSE